MHKIFLCLLLLLVSTFSYGLEEVTFKIDTVKVDSVKVAKVKADTTQVDTAVSDTTVVVNEEINYWKETNKVGVNLSEVAFINWNSGGE